MPKCSFCGESIPESRGKMFVKNEGKILWFCGSKCESNYGMGRQGKKVRWTPTFRKGKEEGK